MKILGVSLAITLTINVVLFAIAFRRQSDKLTDFAYSFSFIVIALTAFGLSDHRSATAGVAVALVIAWGLRLGGFLVWRIRRTGRDKRFDALRSRFFGFLKFWLAQAVVAWFLLLPLLFMLSGEVRATGILWIGCTVWLLGFVVESLADWQKARFSAKAGNKGKWIDDGLWHYSRHPNYFGEICVWVGIYLVAWSSLGWAERLIGLVSPVAIFITLRFVSGVPMLEKRADEKWGDDPAYQSYKHVTPLIIPRWLTK